MHKKILSTSGYLASASIIEKIGSFILIPILTINLSPTNYGKLITAVTYSGILSLFFYNGLHSSLSRWYSTWQENWDKRLYEKYIFIIINIFALAIALILLILNKFIPFTKVIGVNFYLFIIVYLSTIPLISYNIKSTIWVIEGKSYLNLLVSIAKTITLICLIWFLLPNFKSPIVKPFAEIISLCGIYLYSLKDYFFGNYPKISKANFYQAKTILKESFNYGFSIQLSQILFWIIASSDRIILSKFIGNSAVAFYSILMISIMPVFLIVSFNNSFSVHYLKYMKENNNIKAACNYISTYLLYGGIIIFIYKLILYFFRNKIILSLSTKEYLPVASSLHFGAEILFLYLAYLLFSRNLHFYKNNKAIISIMLISSIINILANIALIPKFGINGSLYGSIISYIAMVAISIFYLNRDAGFKNIKTLIIKLVGVLGVYVVFDIFTFIQ